ncbi:hypothetical protein GW17_00044284 [Ensete ventricosum]|nr:hypothetical protein GW17_00044284 [Ensete ventricosum]
MEVRRRFARFGVGIPLSLSRTCFKKMEAAGESYTYRPSSEPSGLSVDSDGSRVAPSAGLNPPLVIHGCPVSC